MKGVRGVDSSPLPDSYNTTTEEEPQNELLYDLTQEIVSFEKAGLPKI